MRYWIFIVCILLFSSCSKTVKVPVETKEEKVETTEEEQRKEDEKFFEEEKYKKFSKEEQKELLKKIEVLAQEELLPSYGILSYYFSGVDWEEELIYNDFQQEPASVMKIYLMAESMEQVKEGRLSLEDTFVMGWDNMADDAGVIAYESPLGAEYRLKELQEYMMGISDNTASNMIIDAIGGPEAVNARKEEWGLENTLFGTKYIGPGVAPGFDYNTTTTTDIGRLLKRIAKLQLLGPEYDQKMLDLMAKNENRKKIPGLFPEEIKVYNKTGELDALEHDAAIIETHKGRYVLVIFLSQGDNGEFIQRMQNFSLKLVNLLQKEEIK